MIIIIFQHRSFLFSLSRVLSGCSALATWFSVVSKCLRPLGRCSPNHLDSLLSSTTKRTSSWGPFSVLSSVYIRYICCFLFLNVFLSCGQVGKNICMPIFLAVIPVNTHLIPSLWFLLLISFSRSVTLPTLFHLYYHVSIVQFSYVFFFFFLTQGVSCLLRWVRNIDDELHALIAGKDGLCKLSYK